MCSIDLTSPNFEKLIHLDLKGAAPKLSYYEQIFPLLKLFGATGLLMEYEDMFPYDGYLKELSQEEAYSKLEIKKIQKLAEDNNLIILPLVQTFGHLEFLLKHRNFYELREMSRYPNTICPSHPKSASIVLELVNQILQAHPSVKWLHMGADEVWHLGECEKCLKRMNDNKWSKDHLFLDHIYSISQLIKQKYPNISLIIWDDMLRNFDVEIIRESGIGEIVEPMVWHYLPPDEFRLKGPIWNKYSCIFPHVWIASAFKGATEMTQLVTPPRYHVLNHKAWIDVLRTEALNFKHIHGIAITGWQRFDHFTVLCELLPVGMPSLAVCMQVLLDGDLNEEGHQNASRLLGFTDRICLDPFPRPQAIPPVPCFPGGNIYTSCLYLSNLLTEYQLLMHHPSVKGAFSDYHIAHNRTNPLHIDQFLLRTKALLFNMKSLNNQLSACLLEVYYPGTVEEWLATNISPYVENLQKLIKDADEQIEIQLKSTN